MYICVWTFDSIIVNGVLRVLDLEFPILPNHIFSKLHRLSCYGMKMRMQIWIFDSIIFYGVIAVLDWIQHSLFRAEIYKNATSADTWPPTFFIFFKSRENIWTVLKLMRSWFPYEKYKEFYENIGGVTVLGLWTSTDDTLYLYRVLWKHRWRFL